MSIHIDINIDTNTPVKCHRDAPGYQGVCLVKALSILNKTEDAMIAQRVSTLATLLLLPVALPAGLSASVVGHSLTAAVYALPGRSAEPTVQVTNDNRETANVILVGGQGWYVLGLMHGRETRVFDVPPDLVGMQGGMAI